MSVDPTNTLLMVNDLIGYVDDPGFERRVLWVELPSRLVAVIDLRQPGSFPEVVDLDEMLQEMARTPKPSRSRNAIVMRSKPSKHAWDLPSEYPTGRVTGGGRPNSRD